MTDRSGRVANLRARSQAALIAVAVVVLGGCNGTQLVDASGERGGGGLAFLVMAMFFWIFIGALFYMDRVRSRRDEDAGGPPRAR